MTDGDGFVGRRLRDGEYELREVIARGGQATVYRAYSSTRDVDVAVKVLSSRLAGNAEFRARFLDEFRSLAHLHHENVIELYDYHVEDDLAYIVMRLVPGGTLKGRLALLDGPLDPTTVGRLIGQVAAGLEEAHGSGYVHLDIKPANVLLGRADWPLLTDFGITRAIGREQTAGGRERLAGTPLYMSPEQCQGGPIDGRSDQYSLAVTAYELLTRQLPFQSTTTEGLLEQHLYQPPPPPRTYNPGLPEPVEAVLLRGLSKDPADRYPTIRAFGEALGEAVEQTRGMSLEAKAALSTLAPVVLGVSLALLAAPILLATLPTKPSLGPIPFSWPFAFLIRLLVFWGMLRARWPLLGLVARVFGGVAEAVGPKGHPGADARLRWRKRGAALGQGLVELAYLGAGAGLLVLPIIELARYLGGRQAAATFGLIALVVLVALGFHQVVRAGRLGGPLVAAMLSGVLLVRAATLAPVFLIGNGLAASIPDVGLLAAVLLLLALAASIHRMVGHLAVGLIVPPLIEARQITRADEREALASRLRAVAGAIADLVLGVVALVLLAAPLEHLLTRALGSAAAPVLTAISVLIWLALVIRLVLLAGRSGAALGLLLGAPLLRALPLGALLPAEATTLTSLEIWSAAVAGGLALVLLRGTLCGLGEATLSARIERGLSGPLAGPRREDDAERRTRAGRVLVDALLDALLLCLADWIVAAPLDDLLARDGGAPFGVPFGPHWLDAILHFGLLALAALILVNAVARARAILAATGTDGESRMPARAVGLVALLAVLLVAGVRTIPVAMAAPEVFGLDPSDSSAPRLVVDGQFWRPNTPRSTQATYDLALSCSDGSWLGAFHEAVDVRAPGGRPAPMPHGVIGGESPDLACADWRQAYAGLRQAAGVTNPVSFSRDLLDERIVLGTDGTAEVTETHRVLFTAGRYDRLAWTLTLPAGSDLTDPQLDEDGVSYPLGAPDANGYALRVTGAGSQRQLVWTFPPVSSPDQRTYTLRYRLRHVAPTDGALTFPVIAPVEHGPVWFASASVDLPSNISADQLQLDSGATPSRHQLVNGHTAWFETTDLSSDAGFAVSLRFPSAPAPPAPTPTSASGATPIVAAALRDDTPTSTPTSTSTTAATSTAASVTPGASTTATPSATARPKATSSPVASTPTSRPTALGVTPSPVPSDTPTVATANSTATSSPTATSATATTTATPQGACTGDERMSFSPANPVVGQTFTIAVTASRDPGSIRLSGLGNPQEPTKRDFAGGTEWDWQVTPTSPGRLDYYFFAQNSTLCTTNGLVVVAPASPTVAATNTPPPTNTPVPPSATPIPTNTPVPPTATPIPPTATPVPTNTPIPPTATLTPVPKPTNTPTSTPCPALSNPVLSASPNGTTPAINLTWRSTGGCAPYTGSIVGQYYVYSSGSPSSSHTIAISSPSGTVSDTPPSGCWSKITYSLTLKDSSGQQISASASGPSCTIG